MRRKFRIDVDMDKFNIFSKSLSQYVTIWLGKTFPYAIAYVQYGFCKSLFLYF